MKMWRYFLPIAFVPLVMVLYAAYQLYQIEKVSSCVVEQYASSLSPDGKHIAMTYGRDCGATTGYNTQLSIAPAEVSFDPDLFPAVLILKGKLTLNLRWINEARLVVSVPKNAEQYRKEFAASGVTLEYELK